MVLLCILLMISGVEHHFVWCFMCLVTICVVFGKLFNSSAYFLEGFFVVFAKFMSSVYILEIDPLSDI